MRTSRQTRRPFISTVMDNPFELTIKSIQLYFIFKKNSYVSRVEYHFKIKSVFYYLTVNNSLLESLKCILDNMPLEFSRGKRGEACEKEAFLHIEHFRTSSKLRKLLHCNRSNLQSFHIRWPTVTIATALLPAGRDTRTPHDKIYILQTWSGTFLSLTSN